MRKEEAFNVGDRVNHKVFGEGLVLETSGQGEAQRVVVSFSSDRSQRKLLLKYANLTRVDKVEKPSGLS